MKDFLNRVIAILSSRRFFWIIFVFFVFESIWIAFSAIYPMAFDENFHFGLIRVYSHYWLPFLNAQPPHADAYGAVARDPSYLYHYLMSFPYRLIALVVHGQTGQIIILRLLNIGLFSIGLILFRKVLLRARISRALTNMSLLLFALIPIAPQLAAHINYDNLIFPLVAWLCLLTFRACDEIKAGKPSIRTLITFSVVGLLGTQTKYAFAPIFAGAIVFLAIVTYKQFHSQWHKLGSSLLHSWHLQSRPAKIVLATLLVIGCGLFAQRDGLNLVKYHTFTPDCQRVLNVQSCSAYSPWQHSYNTHQVVKSQAGTIKYENPVVYIGSWIYWMWYRLFFAINSSTRGYTNYPPLPLISAAAALIIVTGSIAVIVWRRWLFRDNPYLAFFCFAIGFYVISLWVDGYAQYRYTNELVTMNGRYLLPIMLLMAAIVGRAFSIALRSSPTRKAAASLVVLLLFLQGGGFLTFVSRSDSSWDWPNSTVVKVNNAARKLTSPLIIEGSKYYSTRVWIFN